MMQYLQHYLEMYNHCHPPTITRLHTPKDAPLNPPPLTSPLPQGDVGGELLQDAGEAGAQG